MIKRFSRPKTEVSTIFRWKDQHDVFKTPQEMDSHHLYFTMRMIWNHSVPQDMRIIPYQPYKFGKFYTVEYMAQAVIHLNAELKTRRDLKPEWIKGLVHIRKCLEGREVTKLQQLGNSVSEEGSA